MVHKEMTCVAMQTNDRDWMLWVVVMLLGACLLPRYPDAIVSSDVVGIFAVGLGALALLKRRDPEDVHELAAPVSTASGPGRDYCLPVPVLEAPTLTWLCVGRRRSVMELLRYVTHAGTKRRHGHGAVARWEVEAEDLPPRSVLVRDGVAVRYIPAGWCAWSDSVNRGPSAKTHPSGEHRWR